jgi:hypothetical protein
VLELDRGSCHHVADPSLSLSGLQPMMVIDAGDPFPEAVGRGGTAPSSPPWVCAAGLVAVRVVAAPHQAAPGRTGALDAVLHGAKGHCGIRCLL